MRNEILSSHYFTVEIDGIQTDRFFSCEGLEIETAVYELENGGLNTTTHKFKGRTHSPNIILKKGINKNNELVKWLQRNQNDSKLEKKTLSIILMDLAGIEIKRWNLKNAFPCRWKVDVLNTHDNSFPVEIIEIAYG
jgi:phage tail-like protein